VTSPSAADPITRASAARVPDAHLFNAGGRQMVFAVHEGRAIELDANLAEVFDRAVHYRDDARVRQLLAYAGAHAVHPHEAPPCEVTLKALSLAVAQTCNLGCSYCYAQQGTFGGDGRHMEFDVARRAIDLLIGGVPSGAKVCVAFMGGEPLLNRGVLHAATRYAIERAGDAGVNVSFALTTNATLLTAADADFLDANRFAVTISVDGTREIHNLLRPFKSGRGSYDRVTDGARHLLRRSPRHARTTARVTVTPRSRDLRTTLDELIDMGFDGVQFSPVLRSPSGCDQLNAAALDAFLEEMIACSHVFAAKLVENRHYPFLNVLNTLQRIHNGVADAYPCGAGGGYMGVSAAGDLSACHRFVGDAEGAMGDVTNGIDRLRRQRWLTLRNVHAQHPCQTCWARHLCGGGCHYEEIHAGRTACDYIRGWLHHCLGLYAKLRFDHPQQLTWALASLQAGA
jgi:uncharacterized protein